MKTFVLALLSLALTAQTTIAQNLIHELPGDLTGDRLGWSVGTAGDVDGDGVPDLIAGAPRADVNGVSSGSARVDSGATGLTIWTFHGDSTSDQLGWAVDGVGDMTGDGRAELIAGAPFDDDNGANAGLARVYNGATGATLYTVNGDATLDVFGKAVAGAGDVNNDTVPDFIVGAPQENTANPGYARIYSGLDGSVIRTLSEGTTSQYGISVAGIGDLDDDGFDDVAVGAWLESTLGANRGRVYVHSGFDGSVMHVFDGESDHDWSGWAIAGAGDVNDDGVPDLIVGEYGADDTADAAGRARVYSGFDWSTLLVLQGESANEQFGFSVGGAGDVNGDGKDDLVVGAPFTANGRARIFSGSNGDVLLAIDGPASGDTLGRDVAGLGGDINGDGHADVLLGAPLDDDAGTSSGVVTAVSGYWPWKDLGLGLAGTHGVPTLAGLGTLITGDPVSLSLGNALESSSAALFIGLSAVNLPFKGGTLVPSATLVFLGLPTSGSGTLVLSAPWPPGAPPNFSFYFQEWVADGAAPVNFSASNGLSGTTP